MCSRRGAFRRAHCDGNRCKARELLRLDGKRRDWLPAPWEWDDFLAGREGGGR
jgi:hypothetical protein